MKSRKWEIPVGSTSVLESLAEKAGGSSREPHPLQELIEEIIASVLTEDEQEIFYMRYGQLLPIRAIAKELGYTSHYVIQVKLERIQEKVREGIERATTTGLS